jgi:argininosuccinate lyase
MSNKKDKILSTSINKKTSSLMDNFNSSIDVDQRLIQEDISVTRAHVDALFKLGVINKSDLLKINKGLTSIQNDFEQKKIKFTKKNEDIHMNIEFFLHQKIGDTALKLHTGRSRNDQVATDTRLWVMKSSLLLQNEIKELMKSILKQASDHQETIIPGFTHLQVAQPILLAHHLLAYMEMFNRDLDCFEFSIKGSDENVLGSAALAGSNYLIDTNLLNKKLKFSKSKENSMDGVSDRDFCMYFLNACAMTAIHLSKLSAELVLWSSNSFGMFKVNSEYSTGSSIMPQKRNPDSLELIRAKANIIRTKSLEFSNIISGLPLTYFKDFQEDKKIIFESYDELTTCLKVMTDVIKKSEFEKKQGLKICNEFFATATDLADYLVIKKNIPFRNSYKIIAQIVSYAQKNKKSLSDVSLKEFQLYEKSITKDIYEYIDVEKSLYRKKTKMSTNPRLVSQKIDRYLKLLK